MRLLRELGPSAEEQGSEEPPEEGEPFAPDVEALRRATIRYCQRCFVIRIHYEAFRQISTDFFPQLFSSLTEKRLMIQK